MPTTSFKTIQQPISPLFQHLLIRNNQGIMPWKQQQQSNSKDRDYYVARGQKWVNE